MSEESVEQEVEFDRTSEHEGERIDTAGMMLRVKARLRHHEGWVNHMYRDTKGNVTVGVGFHLEKRSDAWGYSWRYKKTTRTAPLPIAEAEWVKVSRLPYGPNIRAAKFDKDTTIELSDSMIGFILTKKLLRLRDDLRRVFARESEDGGKEIPGVDFDTLPETVQEALLDLGWNVIDFQKSHVFPKLKIAIKTRDWNTAAVESHRESPPIPETRNNEIYGLIKSAADETRIRAVRH